MKANSIRGWRLMCFLSRTILFSEKKKSNALLVVRFQEEVKGVPWVKWTFAGTSSKSSSSIFKACSKCLGRKSGSDAQWHFLGCVLRTSLTLLCSLLLKDKAHHPPTRLTQPCPFLSRTAFHAASECELQKLIPQATLFYLVYAFILLASHMLEGFKDAKDFG